MVGGCVLNECGPLFQPLRNAHEQSTMTTNVPGMRSNKSVSMDIEQLRGWASIMDRAMIASLVATILAVTALGITTFLSFRYSGAVRVHEQAALERYQGLESQAAQREREATAAREQVTTLEREIATAQGRTAMLEQEVALARERAAAFELAAREATERAARMPRESAPATETARNPLFDAAEIRRRLADLGKLVRDATTRSPEPARERSPEKASELPPSTVPASPPPPPPPPEPSPFVASLQRFAGTKAALFLLGQIADAPAIGTTISADLSQAGWLPQTWTWGGVAGIFGVVVLVRDGSDPATHEAAAALVDALGAAGFNASKGDWPANWGRFRGTLNGPQTPSPTEAAIRIVVGEKARKAP